MPQLNPAPWFSILITTWLITFALLKLTSHTHSVQSPQVTTQTLHSTPWPWMWQ